METEKEETGRGKVRRNWTGGEKVRIRMEEKLRKETRKDGVE